MEVFYDNVWGTVCDDEWDLNDAIVVCHSLGYYGPVQHFTEAHYGAGTGTIWLDNVQCNGNVL